MSDSTVVPTPALRMRHLRDRLGAAHARADERFVVFKNRYTPTPEIQLDPAHNVSAGELATLPTPVN